MTTQTNTGQDLRLAALRRFATVFTLFVIAGHMFLGFESSYANVVVALIAGYAMDLLLETVDAWAQDKTPRYRGGLGTLVDFLLPAHISSLAVSLLLYSNQQMLPIAFASALAIGSKFIFRIKIEGKYRHFLNPSNTGIAITLILFPWVGITPPYQYTENFSGAPDWFILLFFLAFGTFLNARYARRIPLIVGWVVGFVIQALLRSWYEGIPMIAGLEIMTGVAFLLFTFYMIEDPGSTPFKPLPQVIFGLSVAAAYGILMMLHIVFGLFFALFAVCIVRGLYLYFVAYRSGKTATVMQSVPLAGEVTS